MTKAEKTMFLSVLATPIAREGWPFIAAFGIAIVILVVVAAAVAVTRAVAVAVAV